MRLVYHHARTGALIENRQAIRVPREGLELRMGARAEVLCWGVMPSGMLRHPLLVRSVAAAEDPGRRA